VISHAPPRERLSRESQLEKLTQCEDDLSQVATNVTELIAELQSLRTGSEELGRALAEREAVLDQQRSAVSMYEEERSRLHEQAGAMSEALRASETRRLEHEARAAALVIELDALRAAVGERERRLVALTAQHELACGKLDERQGEFDEARAAAEAAALELAETRRAGGSDGQAAAVGHVRLLALPDGYRLSESDDPVPATGDVVREGFGECVVVRIGPSPFPGDKRRCAVLSFAQT
jgi:chromosome segregation ATPase